MNPPLSLPRSYRGFCLVLACVVWNIHALDLMGQNGHANVNSGQLSRQGPFYRHAEPSHWDDENSTNRGTTEQPASCDTCSAGIQVERGKRRPVIDALGCLWGIPDKLLLWDRRAKNHDVSEQTVDEVVRYLDYRGLHETTVRVNQYDPVGEWKRLVANRSVGAPWRYTVGVLKQAKYIIFPGRIFGRDEYNPYTNTLSLYSDMPSLGLAEAAYAHDVSNRCLPGTYATAQLIPPIAIWHETLATDEALHYVSIRGSSEHQSKVRRDLYARYGIALGGEISAVLPDGSCLYPLAGAITGHTLATLQAIAERH